MRIVFNPINMNNTNPRTAVFQGGRNKLPAPAQDLFIKSTEDLLSLPRNEIFKRIRNSFMKEENMLGRGGDAEVWKIENSDYCVRVPHDSFGRIFSRFSKRLNRDDRSNHVVAKLAQNATIMKFIPGFTFDGKKNEDKKIALMIENMPVEAFTDLFKQIKTAEHNSDLSFDCGFKNIIINPEKQTMTAIDFYKSEDHLFKDEIFSGIFASLGFKQASTDEQLKTCAGKLILAALSVQETNPEMKPFESGFHRLIYTLREKGLIEPPAYAKILIQNAEELQINSNLRAKKTIEALVKQLFGVNDKVR
ncbi:MAG: hypothetical protein NC408_01895 [Candidatus Gastranaerophilales bacterium]|nr:hypothetical protein [Candidatus Gastranaerophilales bacterium]MCM1073183.1 hypothetical protein [Bacteroides sp.]